MKNQLSKNKEILWVIVWMAIMIVIAILLT